MIDQLPLNFQLRDDATFSSFYPSENEEALYAVQQCANAKGDNFIFLWGQEGVGKSHLLQAACQHSSEKGNPSVYIPLQDKSEFSLSLLKDFEEIPLVCIDDIDSIANLPLWEEALFHFFNRIRAQNGYLIISANTSPKELKINLPDLKSRLTWGVVYQLHRLQDDDKIHALQLRAHQRGLHLNKTVGQFLLSRCSRNMAELFNTLEILDRASLAEQRRLTVPFVKHVLEI